MAHLRTVVTTFALLLIASTCPAEELYLQCQTALADGCEKSDGVMFLVTVIDGDGKAHIVRRQPVVRTKRSRPVQVDLSPFAGQTIQLKIEADPGPRNQASWDCAMLIAPTIHYGDEIVVDLVSRLKDQPDTVKCSVLRRDGKTLGNGAAGAQIYPDGKAINGDKPASCITMHPPYRGIVGRAVATFTDIALPAPAEPLQQPQFDSFGGWTGIKGTNDTGFFTVEKIDGRWWLITPENNAFFSYGTIWLFWDNNHPTYKGIYRSPTLVYSPNVLSMRAKNDDYHAWVAKSRKRYDDWNMNTLGARCHPLTGLAEMDEIIGFTWHGYRYGVPKVPTTPGHHFPDVFDEKWEPACMKTAEKVLAPHADNPWRIGGWTDNEINWGKNYGEKRSMVDCFIQLEPSFAGKQAWVDMLKDKYGTVEKLNETYGLAFNDWRGEGNTVEACTRIEDSDEHPDILADKVAFMEMLCEKYYAGCAKAAKKHDPNHLLFSDRLAGSAEHMEITSYSRPFVEASWKAAGRHCDVFSINHYHNLGRNEKDHLWLTRIFECTGGLPILISENDSVARDTIFPWRWVPNQAGRAHTLQSFLNDAITMRLGPEKEYPIVGYHWYAWMDESVWSPGGSAQGRVGWQCGLINGKDEAYTTLVETFAQIGKDLYPALIGNRELNVLWRPTPKAGKTEDIPLTQRTSRQYTRYLANGGMLINTTTGEEAGNMAAADRKVRRSGKGDVGYLRRGPYWVEQTLPGGKLMTVDFRLLTSDNKTDDVVAVLSVTSAGRAEAWARREIRGTEFKRAKFFQTFPVTFRLPDDAPPSWDYCVWVTGKAPMQLDTTSVTYADPGRYETGPLTDGKQATLWRSPAYPQAQAKLTVAVDLGKVRDGVRQLRVLPGTVEPTGMPRAFKLQLSLDGESWSDIPGQAYTDFTNPGGEVAFRFAPIRAGFLRLVTSELAADAEGNHRLVLAELSVPQPMQPHRPTLAWTGPKNNEIDSYTLLLSPEHCFPEDQLIRAENLTATRYTPDQPLASGPWWWTVKAHAADGRIGHYSEPWRFELAVPETIDTAAALACEDITAWEITDPDRACGWGYGFVFADRQVKTQGDQAARIVLTANSRHKQTGDINPAASTVPVRLHTGSLDIPAGASLTFQISPAKYYGIPKKKIPASRYLHVRLLDGKGKVIADAPIDPEGKLPIGEFSQVSLPLGLDAPVNAASLEFYVDCGEKDLAWDTRLTAHVDAITITE